MPQDEELETEKQAIIAQIEALQQRLEQLEDTGEPPPEEPPLHKVSGAGAACKQP